MRPRSVSMWLSIFAIQCFIFLVIFPLTSAENAANDLATNETSSTSEFLIRKTSTISLPTQKTVATNEKIFFASSRIFTLKSAESYCKNEGGRLATIKSAAENARAIAVMKPNNFYWFGLRRNGASDPWRWADGTLLNYTNWNTGEPNNKNDEEYCAEAYSFNGKWNDVTCGQWIHKNALCEQGGLKTHSTTASTKKSTVCLPPRSDESLIGFWLADLETYNKSYVERSHANKEKTQQQICGDVEPSIEGPFGQNNTAFVLTCQNGTFFIWEMPNEPITSFTISFYYRYTDEAPGSYGLMSFHDDSPKSNFVIDYQVGENGTATLIISYGPGPAISRMSLPDIMKPNKWNFISVMFDGSTMQLTVFYYNSDNELESVVSNALLVGSRGRLAIGQGNYEMPIKTGAISCLLFYRQTLTPLELEQIQQACRFRQTAKCDPAIATVISSSERKIKVIDRRKPLPPKIPSLLGVWFLDDLYGLENKIPGKTKLHQSETDPSCAALDDKMPGPFGRLKTSMEQNCETGELVQFQWLFPSSETQNWLESFSVSFYFFGQSGDSLNEHGIFLLYPYVLLTYNETAGVAEIRIEASHQQQERSDPVVIAALAAGEWHFIAVTFNMTTKNLSLHIHSSTVRTAVSALIIPHTRSEEGEGEFKFLIGSDGRTNVKRGDKFSCLFLYGAALTLLELDQVETVCENRLSPEKAEDEKLAITSIAEQNWYTLVATHETVLPTSSTRGRSSLGPATSSTKPSPIILPTSQDNTNATSTSSQTDTKKHFFTIHFRMFRDAERSCENAGGKLAMIKSAEENAQAAAVMQSDYRYWISLKRVTATDSWRWLDGTLLNFTKWNIGEPNNAHGDEFCAEYAPNGRWNDVQCSGNKGVLCEEQIKLPTHKFTMGTVLDLEEPQLSNEYFAIETNLTWFDARDRCSEEGGQLAMIKSKEENARAYEVMTASDRSRTFWLGLRREDSDSPWLWIDGTELNYSNWNYGEPNNNHNNEWCTSARPGQRRRWNDLRCDYNQYHAVQLNWDDTPYALCERRTDNVPPPKQPLRTRKKYFTIYGSYRADRAIALCQELGGRPASIKSAAENDQAVSVMAKHDHYWIGLSRGLGVHESWSWPDGSDLEYSNWDLASGQPDSRGGHEWCVEYRSFRWNDLACENMANILCEKIYHYYDNILGNETINVTAKAQLNELEKKYFAAYEPHLTYQDAVKKCGRNGGRLATIKSPEENSRATLTMKTVPGIYWIGLSRENDTSPWRWVDGNELRYSNWDDLAGEPSNQNGDELCAEARINTDHPQMSYMWNALSCDNTRRNKIALCEKFVYPPTTKTPKTSDATTPYNSSSTTTISGKLAAGGKGSVAGNIILAIGVTMGVSQIAILLVYYFCVIRRRRFGCPSRRRRANVDDDTKLANERVALSMAVLQSNNKDAFEVTWDKVIKLPEVLGEGDFGKVIRGKFLWTKDEDEDEDENKKKEVREIDVAVKLLQENATEEQRLGLLREIQLLKHMSDVCGPHPNLVALLGCITSTSDDESNCGQMAFIMEYCPLGSLRTYLRNLRGKSPQEIKMLRKHKSINNDSPAIKRVTFYPRSSRARPRDHHEPSTSSEAAAAPTLSKNRPADLPDGQNRPLLKLLLSYAEQICAGMEHLARNMFVHRNLAARNILVFDYDKVKIAHFHMARDMYEDPKGVKVAPARVHVKWTAPEAIEDRVYTSASDVWSFGVVLWELVTLGALPYSLVLNQEMVSVLKKGHRLERPSRNCPEELYEIMLSCWVLKPDDRPNFTSLHQRLLYLQQKYAEQQS